MAASIVRLNRTDGRIPEHRRRQFPLSKNRSRKSKSRGEALRGTVLLTIVLIPVFLGVLFTGFRVLRADDGRWMPSGRVLQGLGPDHSKETNSTAQRNQWMAKVRESAWSFIVIHHSASRLGSVESIHKEHSEREDGNGNRWLGIGYHFVIGNGHGMGDGEIEATFRWNEQIHGAHSGNAMFNARGIGICLIGNFEDHPPTPNQVKAVRELVKTLAVRHQISRSKVMGHGAVKATACPGKHFPLKELRAVIPENREG